MPSPKGCQLLPPWLAQPELCRHNGEVDHLDWRPEEVVVHIHPWEPGQEVINKSSNLKDMIIHTNSLGHKHECGLFALFARLGKKTKQFMILDVYILVFDILQAC